MTLFLLIYLVGMIAYTVYLHFDSSSERQLEQPQIEDGEIKADKAFEIILWPMGVFILLLCWYQERIEKKTAEKRVENWREGEGGR